MRSYKVFSGKGTTDTTTDPIEIYLNIPESTITDASGNYYFTFPLYITRIEVLRGSVSGNDRVQIFRKHKFGWAIPLTDPTDIPDGVQGLVLYDMRVEEALKQRPIQNGETIVMKFFNDSAISKDVMILVSGVMIK